ncbi:MAG: hypothetical protein ACREDM_05160 [Methylocella sp.]
MDGPRSPASMCHKAAAGERHDREEPSTRHIATTGLDLAKLWFQIHGAGRGQDRRQTKIAPALAFFRRQVPCLVGIVAAGTRICGPVRHARTRSTKDAEWTRALLAGGPAKAVAVALANKTARMVWAVMARGEPCRAKEIAGQAA